MSADATKSESSDAVTAGFLDSFADAWNRHDVDAILSMMSHDCVFEASRGPDVKGTVYVGQEAVRRGIEEVFATFPDAQWRRPSHFMAGDRGVSEWIFTAPARTARGSRFKAATCSRFAMAKSPSRTRIESNACLDFHYWRWAWNCTFGRANCRNSAPQ
jgi:hypothetical protein